MRVIETSEGVHVVTLTVEEEMDLARVVLDCIALRWVSGDFQSLLDRMFWAKGMVGASPVAEDIFALFGFLERYELNGPEFTNDGRNIRDDFRENGTPDDQLEAESRKSVISIWREAWDNHTSIKTVADQYRSFPGDDERAADDEAQKVDAETFQILETAFWEEVDKVVQAYECSRQDAYTMVSDYMPRGDFLFDGPTMAREGASDDRYHIDHPKWLNPGL